MRFSVLMSIYHKENPDFLKKSLKSICEEQSIKPEEIILVKDGPLNKELDQIIEEYKQNIPLKTIPLPENMGLGITLAKGLKYCSNELVARMDTDDIASSDRFEKQLKYFNENPEITFISSNIGEFESDPQEISGVRKIPCTHDEILIFAKRRNPMNHMTVMFKKSAVLAAGNYLPFPGYEDYYLWVRMLLKGFKAANIPENLVFARVGNNMLARRQGFKFFKQELRLQKTFYSIKFIGFITLLKNVCFRALPRLMPVWGLRLVYKTLRK